MYLKEQNHVVKLAEPLFFRDQHLFEGALQRRYGIFFVEMFSLSLEAHVSFEVWQTPILRAEHRKVG